MVCSRETIHCPFVVPVDTLLTFFAPLARFSNLADSPDSVGAVSNRTGIRLNRGFNGLHRLRRLRDLYVFWYVQPQRGGICVEKVLSIILNPVGVAFVLIVSN